jgi:adenylate cyclase
MRIRYKFLFIVIPLIIAPIAIGGISSSLSTRNAITGIAREAIQFKAEELQKYAWAQWNLLVENNLEQRAAYVQAAEDSIQLYADGLIRSQTELFAAVRSDGTLVFSTSDIEINQAEQEQLALLYRQENSDWLHFTIGGIERVGQTINFEPLGWMFLVTERESTFYEVVREINQRTVIILMSVLVISVALIMLFTRILLRPLQNLNHVITGIIRSGDLARRVPLEYRDEIGDLGYRFNIMSENLQEAYDQIKRYAYRAVIARSQERKIRNIFHLN